MLSNIKPEMIEKNFNPATFKMFQSTDILSQFNEAEIERAKENLTKIQNILNKGKTAVDQQTEVYFSAEETAYVGKIRFFFSRIDFTKLETDVSGFVKDFMSKFINLAAKDFDQIAAEINKDEE
jgi:hypothetical protein